MISAMGNDIDKSEISIIIPAFNEGDNLEAAVNGLYNCLKHRGMDDKVEIIVFNDKSTDDTGKIADNLAKRIGQVKVVHNERNMGLGYNFIEGARRAVGKYVTWFPADNENMPEYFVDTFGYVGEADIILSYTSNAAEVRPLLRRIVSGVYTWANNFLFGLHIRYYNGLNIYPRAMLLKLPPIGRNFAFAVEIVVRLLKSGASFVEVPVKIGSRASGKSSALKLKNVLKVMAAILALCWDINVKKERVNI